MLGVFDSGFGGLTVLKPIHERLPNLSTIYLGDNARAPYGVRTQEEIFQFTLEGVRFLFEKGCPLVVLACNTASSQALRKIQQEILPVEFPDRRVLGVIRPAAEYLATHGRRIGIFATPATVQSQAFVHELNHLCALCPPLSTFSITAITVTQVACPGLTDLIESGQQESETCDRLVKHFVDELLDQDPHIEEILLACTHYPLVLDLFRRHVPSHINVLTQGDIVAQSLADYLLRHQEMYARLDHAGARTAFTTSEKDLSRFASLFYGQAVQFTNITTT
jgi:glutamate racemase